MPAEVKVYEATPAAGDVLLVRGEVDGEAVETRGWVSALTNHYPASSYYPADHDNPRLAGHRDPEVEPRKMSAREVRAYLEQLLLEQAGVVERPAVLDKVNYDTAPSGEPAER
jgi:hypothetical protein